MGAQGDGLAQGPHGALFAPYTLPGETVRGRIDKDRLALDAVLTPSPERVEPFCSHFGTCGGCLLQHWQLEPYFAWKRTLVAEALAREGIEAQVHPVVDAHGAGRRRVIFHARQYGARTVVGFAERRSHAMVALDACPVLAPSLDAALPAARAVAAALAPLKKPLDLQVVATDTGLDMDVRGSGPLPPALLVDVAAIAERFGLARLTRHGELVLQRTAPILSMGRAKVELPPAAFLQATAEGEHVLADAVLAASAGARRVADLFAGAGTFALRLAETARVFAAESHAGALAALMKASRATPGLKAVEGEARDLFRRPLMAAELAAFDTVVIDPPRQGAEAQARELAQAKLARLVYVSCNAATFARDARLLIAGGFRLVEVTPVDQFRYSPHVELVAFFQRG
ncbi:RNA methyltransferase [Xanthobacter autotrophicus]|uniref:class I SAM-dependent RNA methyltransferase n=1 Tax=Xanthobacter TaxID=279 RepID=UPI0024AC7F44|nr:RNA methyltransferase [Xanthobacter autotrophicus]MDI4666410.1 RNA methyltransferase [Xanthobacter autotrophicus]